MRFLIVSDLHLEFGGFTPRPGALDGVDALILSGDTMANTRKLPSWAARPSVFGPDMPILIVLGNHEFYGGQVEVRRREMQEAAAEFPNVHVLDPGEVLLDGGRVRILGCTLWTDFQLDVGAAAGELERGARAMSVAQMSMNDYQTIRISDAGGLRRLRPADTLSFHQTERAWLLAKLQEPFAGQTVVVTHHGPSAGSVAPRWANDSLSPAFSSNLPDEFFEVPALWIHGHTHDSRDYERGRTRVLCNPRGYLMRTGAFENDDFDPALVVEV